MVRAAAVLPPGNARTWRAARVHTMAVACGLHHSAAVAENGTLYVWGLGDYGQHGLGDTNERHVPNRIEGLVGSIAMVEAGGSHTGIVTDDGDLLMCGFGICGQLGLGDEANRQTPIPIDRALFFHEKVKPSCARPQPASYQHLLMSDNAPPFSLAHLNGI